MLIIGAFLFIAVGCLVMTAVDSVPESLVINALILGTLSIVTGMVFILDTCMSNRRNDKKSKLPKNTRYGDIARTKTAAVDNVDSIRVTNGLHANGEKQANGEKHANGTNGVHANGATHANGVQANGLGGILKRETVEKKQSGLLQTTANGRAAVTRNEGGQTSLRPTRAEEETVYDYDDEDEGAADGATPVHQYGRKYLDNRGFSGYKHAEWYDTEMDLPKMKKLEINVPPEGSPDYRRRYVVGTYHSGRRG